MRSFCFALCIAVVINVNQSFGSETGMPQLNHEFWIAQTFWLILIFFSDTRICRIFVTSIFPFLILSSAYIFILYKSYLSSYDFVSNFNLYTSKDSLKNLFSNDFFIMMFWIHFISINLFTGGWIVKDSQKLAINKPLIILPLVITYLIGPIGLLIYWLIRL